MGRDAHGQEGRVGCVDQLLRDIMGNDLPFEGKAFVGLGDFRQITPVIRGASEPAATLDNSIQYTKYY
jgi:PIF1-like helicase